MISKIIKDTCRTEHNITQHQLATPTPAPHRLVVDHKDICVGSVNKEDNPITSWLKDNTLHLAAQTHTNRFHKHVTKTQNEKRVRGQIVYNFIFILKARIKRFFSFSTTHIL